MATTQIIRMDSAHSGRNGQEESQGCCKMSVYQDNDRSRPLSLINPEMNFDRDIAMREEHQVTASECNEDFSDETSHECQMRRTSRHLFG